jgi:hypothetical protein
VNVAPITLEGYAFRGRWWTLDDALATRMRDGAKRAVAQVRGADGAVRPTSDATDVPSTRVSKLK